MVQFFTGAVTGSPFLKRSFGLYSKEQMGSTDPPRKQLVIAVSISTCICPPKLPTDTHWCPQPFQVLVPRFLPLHTTSCFAGASQQEYSKSLCFLSQSMNLHPWRFYVQTLNIRMRSFPDASASGASYFAAGMQYSLCHEEQEVPAIPLLHVLTGM